MRRKPSRMARAWLLGAALALLGAPLLAEAQPALSVDPTQVDFGEVPAGSTSGPQVITVSNTTAAGPLSISSIFFIDNYLDQFSFVVFDGAGNEIGPNDFPFDLEPGKPAQIHVYFTASEWASISFATMEVVSNGGTEIIGLSGSTGPAIVPRNTWIPEVVDAGLTPDLVAMAVLTGTNSIAILTAAPTGAGQGELNCHYIYDHTDPTFFNQSSVLESDSLYLGRNIVLLPEGPTAVIADASGLKLLTSAQPSTCQWNATPFTDTLYASADIARFDSGYVVIGYREDTKSIDVFTGDLNGPPVHAAVISGTNTVQGPDIFPPLVSAGDGAYCVHAQGESGYFTTCSDMDLGGRFDSDEVSPGQAAPAAAFFDGAHLVLYHHRLSNSIRLAKIEQGMPITQTLSAAPVQANYIGTTLVEGGPGTMRALWPGGDVEIVVSQVLTRTMPAPFPLSFTTALAAQKLETGDDPPYEIVASGSGSLLFARFVPGPPNAVPTGDRWTGVLIALLLVSSAVLATRRARVG